MNDLASLKTAEKTLIAALRHAAASLDAVGGTALSDALATLEEAARAARGRLAAAPPACRLALFATTEEARQTMESVAALFANDSAADKMDGIKATRDELGEYGYPKRAGSCADFPPPLTAVHMSNGHAHDPSGTALLTEEQKAEVEAIVGEVENNVCQTTHAMTVNGADTCPACGGSGRDRDPDLDCRECKGSGIRAAADATAEKAETDDLNQYFEAALPPPKKRKGRAKKGGA